MVDRDKLNKVELEVFDKVMTFGFSETDAEIIAESLISKKSCSWVNNDPISDAIVKNFNTYLVENNYPIILCVSPVSTRNKYIWEIKSTRKW